MKLSHLIITSSLAIIGTHAATVSLLLSPGNGNHAGFTSADPATFSSAASGDGALSGVAWSEGGANGTLDFIITATSTGADDGNIVRGGAGAFGVSGGINTLLDFDEVIELTFTYTVASGDTPTSVLFNGIAIGNSGAADTATVNTESVAGVSSGTGATYQALTNTASTLTVSVASGDFSINGVQLEVIPEPTSSALLGLGVLGLIARRRR